MISQNIGKLFYNKNKLTFKNNTYFTNNTINVLINIHLSKKSERNIKSKKRMQKGKRLIVACTKKSTQSFQYGFLCGMGNNKKTCYGKMQFGIRFGSHACRCYLSMQVRVRLTSIRLLGVGVLKGRCNDNKKQKMGTRI